MTHLTETEAEKVGAAIRDIMEQVQVYASTYSLAGGRFDDGTKFQQSQEEKDELRRMIAAAISKAILAERERCAALMEDDSQWTFAGSEAAMAVFEDVRELAASAIRGEA